MQQNLLYSLTIDAPTFGYNQRQFKILSELGAAAQGNIYKAEAINWQNSASNIYALKLWNMCQKEKEIICKIIDCQKNQENTQIVKIFDLFQYNSQTCLVMEIGEQDLHKYIATQQNLSGDEKLKIIKQLTLSLQFFHKQLGCIHRDIKPENFIKVGDQFKLIDFGTVRFNTHEPKTAQQGTISYQALEMIEGKHDYSQAVDIWSLACVFYEIFTKEQLFGGKNQSQVKINIKDCHNSQNGIKEKIDKIQANQKFKELLIQMLHPNPNQRINIDQVFTNLNAIKDLNSQLRLGNNNFQNYNFQQPIQNNFQQPNQQFQQPNQQIQQPIQQFQQYNQNISQIRQTNFGGNKVQEQQQYLDNLLNMIQDIQKSMSTLSQHSQEQLTQKILHQELKDFRYKISKDLQTTKNTQKGIDEENEKDQIILKEQNQQIIDLKEKIDECEKNNQEKVNKITELVSEIEKLKQKISSFMQNEIISNNQIAAFQEKEQNLQQDLQFSLQQQQELEKSLQQQYYENDQKSNQIQQLESVNIGLKQQVENEKSKFQEIEKKNQQLQYDLQRKIQEQNLQIQFQLSQYQQQQQQSFLTQTQMIKQPQSIIDQQQPSFLTQTLIMKQPQCIIDQQQLQQQIKMLEQQCNILQNQNLQLIQQGKQQNFNKTQQQEFTASTCENKEKNFGISNLHIDDQIQREIHTFRTLLKDSNRQNINQLNQNFSSFIEDIINQIYRELINFIEIQRQTLTFLCIEINKLADLSKDSSNIFKDQYDQVYNHSKKLYNLNLSLNVKQTEIENASISFKS